MAFSFNYLSPMLLLVYSESDFMLRDFANVDHFIFNFHTFSNPSRATFVLVCFKNCHIVSLTDSALGFARVRRSIRNNVLIHLFLFSDRYMTCF